MKDEKVSSLEEKPRKPKSHLINAGIYVFDEGIFPLIDATPKSPRGEFEITDTIRLLMAKRDVYGFRRPTEWIDVGRPWDLLRANAALLAPLKGATHGQVAPGATVVGEVLVEAGATVRRGSYIEGPTIVGAEAEIGPNCYIRPATSIGPKAKVGNACEVKNSILMASAHVPHQNYVGDSILGERCNLGAGTKVANLRLDEAPVKVVFRGVEVDTGLRKLGVIMADEVTVVTSQHDRTLSAEETVDGFRVIRVRPRFIFKQTPITPRMRGSLRALSADVVHAHSPPPLASHYAGAVASERGIPYVVTYY